MNPRERGFLLLTSHLGDPQSKVLTIAQLRLLAQCVTASQLGQRDGEVRAEDLMELGYNRPSAQRILDLLNREEQLQWYLKKAKMAGCVPITRISDTYPDRLRKKLGLDAPGVLWAKGDVSLLQKPKVSLVGSRELRPENLAFAREAGKQAALQGFVLVSGNARGADREAQEACLENGGNVISVIADNLTEHTVRERVLYLSEDGFDMAFSPQRALLRNRIIHSLSAKTLVAQCGLEKGGTWEGTKGNLRLGLSDVFCFADGSDGTEKLVQMGADPVTTETLRDLSALTPSNLKIY